MADLDDGNAQLYTSITDDVTANSAGVTPASTAVTAVQKALAVGLSPNSPVSGAVTTAAPTYATGTSAALSLTTGGLLRVQDGGVYNSTLPTLTTGQQGVLQLDSSGRLITDTGAVIDYAPAGGNITAADVASTTVFGADGQTIVTGTATAGSTYSIAFTGQNTARIQVTGTWVGSVQAEVSMDNGTIWHPIGIQLSGTEIYTGTFTANFEGLSSVVACTNLRLRAVAYTSGTMAVLVITSLHSAAVKGQVASSPIDGTKPTYSSAVQFTAANAATDIVTIVGSATKLVKILRIWISGTQTTAGLQTFFLIQRFTANTGGTIGGGNALVRHDSRDALATATVNYYTANPTALGASGGAYAIFKTLIPTTASVISYEPLIIDYGNRPGQAILLRNALESVSINLNGVTLAGNVLNINIEWTEE